MVVSPSKHVRTCVVMATLDLCLELPLQRRRDHLWGCGRRFQGGRASGVGLLAFYPVSPPWWTSGDDCTPCGVLDLNRRISLYLCLSVHQGAIPLWGRVGGGHGVVSYHWCHWWQWSPLARWVALSWDSSRCLSLPFPSFCILTWKVHYGIPPLDWLT